MGLDDFALAMEKWAPPFDLTRERILQRRSEMARGVGTSPLSVAVVGGRVSWGC